MILAEKIMSLRKKNGWSQEELAEQLNVSRQSVSKWESGSSIPDLEKIIKMSQIFSVSTDYLLKDNDNDEEPEVTYETESEPDKDVRTISMEFATEYMDTVKNARGKIAAGVATCILSPLVLLILAALSEIPTSGVSEGLAVGVGVSVLLILVASAVLLFVTEGMKLSKYEFLEQEEIALKYGVEANVLRKKEAFDPTFRLSISIGVILCIISAIPVIIAGAMRASDLVCVICVCVLLVFVAGAVLLFITAGMVHDSFLKLLQEEEYSVEKKKVAKKYNGIIGAYWLIMVAIYLGWSFYTNKWDFTWIIWPVAGVLFAAIMGILRTIDGNKSN